MRLSRMGMSIQFVEGVGTLYITQVHHAYYMMSIMRPTLLIQS